MDENWRDELPDELKGDESLASFEDIAGLAKSFIETKKMVGNALRFPSEDANDDQRNAFYSKVLEKAPNLMLKPDFENQEQSDKFFEALGRPKDPSKYEKVKLDDLSFDESREEVIRSAAHAAGLTGKQYKSVVSKMLEYDKENLKNAETTGMEMMRSLRQEWGMAFDDKKAVANKVRETFLDFIPESQMDARTIKALNAIGSQLLEGGAGLGDHRNESESGVMTPADALEQIDEIMNNHEHPYWLPHHPGNAAALDKMVQLRILADPTAERKLARAGFSSG